MKRRMWSLLAVLFVLIFGVSSVWAASGTKSESSTQTKSGSEVSQTKSVSEGAQTKSGSDVGAQTRTKSTSERQDEEVQLMSEPVQVEAKDVSADEKTFKITVSNYEPEKKGKLSVAVWSDKNGQDDLEWITMEEEGDTWTAEVSIKKHKTTGTYRVDVYDSGSGSMVYVGGTFFHVTPPAAAGVSVKNLDNAAGTCEVVVSGVTSVSGVAEVTVPTWCASDQSDIHWYQAKEDSSGNYVAKVDISKHAYHVGNYKADVYVRGENGVFGYVGGTTFQFERTGAAVYAKTTDSGYRISVAGISVPGGLAKLTAAVWSDKGGQDDLKWFEGKYDESDHSSVINYKYGTFSDTGLYYVDVYGVTRDGQMVFIGGTTYTVTAPTAEGVSIKADNAAGTFEVIVKGVSGTVEGVTVPVWSKPDQSDIHWYSAKQNDAGDYVATGSIENHDYHLGTYYADAYLRDINGSMTYAGGGTMSFACFYDNISVGSSSDGKTYPVTITNVIVPGGPKYIVFPTWSKKNGQDDIQWYKATQSGNSYTATVDVSKHKTAGDYEIHAYAMTKGGEMIYLGKTDDLKVTIDVSGTVSVTSIDEQAGKFTVRVNVSGTSPVKNVTVPVWCADDQSDIHWYEAEQVSANVYEVKVSVSKHKNNLGVYKIDVYGTLASGIQQYLCGTTQFFSPANFIAVSKTGNKGERQITLKNVSAGASKVSFAVWSDTGGQDDLKWNKAEKIAEGVWSVTVPVRRYKHEGTFHVHAYVNDAFVSAGSFKVDKSEMGKNGWYYENGLKLYYQDDVQVTDLRGIVGGPYQIRVNRACNTITLYSAQGESDYIIPVVAFVCSVGLPDTPTPAGIYYTGAKYRWKTLMGPSYGQYVTHVVDGVYFHSVAGYNTTSYNLDPNDFNMLGNAASHGCIRMCVRDAKWLYENVPSGTMIYIYDDASPGPLGKPVLPKIPPSQNWDPTDPNI